MQVPDANRYLAIAMMVLMVICVACSNSTVDENEQDKETPDLEKILKDMVLIPAGEFLMGSKEGEGAFDEHPQHTVYLDAYYIDKYEVTNVQFKEFVETTGYVTDAERKGQGEVWNPREVVRWKLRSFNGVNWKHPNAFGERYPTVWENYDIADRMNHPVAQISWNDAEAYCRWAGKHLPTEAEWEKAARGSKGLIWPWGEDFEPQKAKPTAYSMIDGEPVPVGQFSTDVSAYGVYDMAGNVREWVADWYAPDYYTQNPAKNPMGPETGKFRVLRGGSWANSDTSNLRCASRTYKPPDYSSNFVGFRCAWNP